MTPSDMASAAWSRLHSLPFVVESIGRRPLELEAGSGWKRRTTVLVLEGGGHRGEGEDVTYDGDDQARFQALDASDFAYLEGRWTLAGWGEAVGGREWFPQPPTQPAARHYRRWAFESAALDLALRQNGLALSEAVGRDPAPVRFVASLGLGSPPTIEPLERLRAASPGLGFKVDLASDWTTETVAALRELGGVAVVDLKGQYRGAFTGPPADAEQYRAVAEGLPDAWIEDPALEGDLAALMAPHMGRVTWDAILHSVADLDALPVEPRCVNIKPSRFGRLEELLAVYAWCEARGVAMYGGGQFELGPGRRQIQALASLFHPEGPNDVAPVAFHGVPRTGPVGALPASPLPALAEVPGLGARE